MSSLLDGIDMWPGHGESKLANGWMFNSSRNKIHNLELLESSIVAN